MSLVSELPPWFCTSFPLEELQSSDSVLSPWRRSEAAWVELQRGRQSIEAEQQDSLKGFL